MSLVEVGGGQTPGQGQRPQAKGQTPRWGQKSEAGDDAGRLGRGESQRKQQFSFTKIKRDLTEKSKKSKKFSVVKHSLFFLYFDFFDFAVRNFLLF
jgi:hypothetical protein